MASRKPGEPDILELPRPGVESGGYIELVRENAPRNILVETRVFSESVSGK